MEERRKKPVVHRDIAARLIETWNLNVVQARYSQNGNWYSKLARFPSALLDANGYFIFATEQDFLSSPYLRIGKEVNVHKPGISGIPGYVRFPEQVPEPDIDIHAISATEGNRKLVIHLQRERNQSIIKAKKKHAKSFDCEICGFSFERIYGGKAKDYCEVHHLIKLSEAEEVTETRIKDLAILCSNCHRVVHLRNPPFTLYEVRSMLTK